MNSTRELSIDSIRIDGGTQSRVEIDEDYVAELVECIDALPPPIVLVEGDNFWMADGFHRVYAHRKAGRKVIRCVCRHGTKRQAVKFSLQANSTHGKRRTNEDKRRAVQIALADAEWSKLSNRDIADLCKVTHTLVNKMRDEANGSKKVLKVEAVSTPTDPIDQEPEAKEVLPSETWEDAPDDGVSAVPRQCYAYDPAKPWAEFEDDMREQMTALRVVRKSLREILEVSEDNNIQNPWGQYYSYPGVIGQINQLIRVIEDGLPVEESSTDKRGYISKQRREILQKSKVA
jgi:hypothetical protein